MSGETGLDLGFTTEQEQIRDTARGFATRALTREFLREIDASGRAPHELLPQMAALGFNGLSVPVEHGGVGGSATDVSVLLEEFGRHSLSVASLLNRALGWGVGAILKFGSEAQKRHYLPLVVSGDMIFAFSHTEADAGSDAASIRTRATADADGFVITGSKMFTRLIREEKYDEALAQLQSPPASFAALYADRRGDILAEQGKPQDARQAWQEALTLLGQGDPLTQAVQLKLDALSGV